MTRTATNRPLDGVRVVEFGEFAAGPFCGLILADWGADVVKVEPPGGDRLRAWPPYLTDADGGSVSANFVALNRNKRSVRLDLTSPADRAAAIDLCLAADVVLENHRPGVMSRRGLDYARLAAENPRLVYCAITGYGQSGPYATRGAFDVAIQAISGIMSVTGEEGGPPAKSGVAVADFLAGSYGATSILAALRRAERTGVGGLVDCSMLSCMLSVATIQVSEFWGLGVPPVRLGTRHPQNAPYQAFRGSDDWFVVAAGTQLQWESLCRLVGLDALVADARFVDQQARVHNQAELERILMPLFAARPAAEWIDDLAAAGVPSSPVYSYEQVLADRHVNESGILVAVPLPAGGSAKALANPVRLTGYQFEAFRPPPPLGAHNADVLDEWCGAPAPSVSDHRRRERPANLESNDDQ